MKVAIIGKGNVGSALAKGLERGGHEIKFGHRDPVESVSAASEWGEVIILAVPYSNSGDAIAEIKPYANGKTVIDVMNAVDKNMNWAISCTTSTAEETQMKLPEAHVVKAFNTVFAQNQSTAKVGEEVLTAFLAGDHLEAKQIVEKLTTDMGFNPVDCGPLKSARYLEAMGIMIISLGYKYGMGTKIGYKLVKA